MKITQTTNMQFALKKFGESYEYQNDVIHATINDMEIINNLIANYNGNDYPKFERNLFKTESAIMFDFLKYVNDIEMNGVLENFDGMQMEMENQK
jgi:hypothetical protein